MESLFPLLRVVSARRVVAWGIVLAGLTPLRAITIDPLVANANVAGTLANALFASGTTLVDTPSVRGGNLGTANSSAGLFTNGLTTGIGLDSGVLLTSGQANLVGDLNKSDAFSSNFSNNDPLSGDPQLTLLAGVDTFDTTSLTFRFTLPTPGDLSFKFVFGSEEYLESITRSFNDVVGIFVDGNNIAVLPGTTTPIAIHTVNPGTAAEFFNNNTLPNAAFPFEYDGFTDVLTATAFGLAAGEHTIKFAVADGFDGSLDSGLFIQRGTFAPRTPPQGVPDHTNAAVLLAVSLVGLVAWKRRRSQIVTA